MWSEHIPRRFCRLPNLLNAPHAPMTATAAGRRGIPGMLSPGYHRSDLTGMEQSQTKKNVPCPTIDIQFLVSTDEPSCLILPIALFATKRCGQRAHVVGGVCKSPKLWLINHAAANMLCEVFDMESPDQLFPNLEASSPSAIIIPSKNHQR